MISVADYKSEAEIQWCPGCPNFGILQTWKKVLAELDLPPDRLCLVSGIGQAAKLPHYLKCNFFNGLHGRALPAATAIKTANPELTVVVTTGEGDCYGEGGNHLLHAFRRNPDITLAVHNNELYALTLGQASPTTPPGEKRSIQVKGVDEAPLNMLAVAMVQGCTFVARGFAGDQEHLGEILGEAVRHEGFSYVDIVQPCITWGTRPVSWYKERVVRLGEDHDPADRQKALQTVLDPGEKIPVGVLYRTDPKPVFGHRFRKAVSGGRPFADLPPLDREGAAEILSEFRAGE